MNKQLALVVDIDRCLGCWACTAGCRVQNEIPLGIVLNRVVEAVRGTYPQLVARCFPVMCQHCQKPPCVEVCPSGVLLRGQDGIVLTGPEKCEGCALCKLSCPAGLSPRSYVGLIAQGRYQEAMDVVRELIPFPGICGRVCKHPCEAECLRAQVDEPVAIASLKRFLADWERENGGPVIAPVPRTKEEGVAIIGSGPAGLTAASDLVRMGYGVTVYEALPVAGGMLSVGIRPDRLPKDIVEWEIKVLTDMGVEIRLNTRLGKDITLDSLRAEGYKAIFLAVGAQRSRPLGVEGVDLEGVTNALDVLRALNLGQPASLKGQVVLVIGGGDVAMDAARSAVRLQAKEVHIICLESREEMPAGKDEIEGALEERVVLHPRLGPKRILGQNGKVIGVETLAVASVFDAAGGFNPVFLPGTESTINGDTVILAIGQMPDLSFLTDNVVEVTPGGMVAVNPDTMATSLPGVFAGGDVIGGRMSLVYAIAAGHNAARAIDSYVKGEMYTRLLSPAKPWTGLEDTTKVEKASRQKMPVISLTQRRKGFAEIELGFTEEMAIKEAQRCLQCSACQEACPYGAITYDPRRDGILKCNLCAHLIGDGKEPQCVATCMNKALWFGDIGDPESAVSKLIADRGGFILMPQANTEPSVHYLENRRQAKAWLSSEPLS